MQQINRQTGTRIDATYNRDRVFVKAAKGLLALAKRGIGRISSKAGEFLQVMKRSDAKLHPLSEAATPCLSFFSPPRGFLKKASQILLCLFISSAYADNPCSPTGLITGKAVEEFGEKAVRKLGGDSAVKGDVVLLLQLEGNIRRLVITERLVTLLKAKHLQMGRLL